MDEHIRIAYYVHDINDPAVARRVRAFHAGGARVVVAGFRRDDRIPAEIDGAPAIDLGRTADARLARRALSVVAALLRPAVLTKAADGASVVVGRNLEALALAVRARRVVPEARLVYECLDIHRTLLGRSSAARAIQWIERSLLRAIDLLIVSSPAFLTGHFDRLPGRRAPSLVVENKLLALDGPPQPSDAPSGPPWTIGWFGNLRCRRSFDVLTRLAARHDGAIRILIAGRPSPAEFPDFAGLIEAAHHCDYSGPFTPADLPGLYARCHFAWAIDYFEEGLNSTWLLPNRLYEASSFGTVPIALRGVETGRWLARHDAGLLLGDEEPMQRLSELFSTLDGVSYASLRDGIAAIPRDDLIDDRDACKALLRAVCGE